MNKNLLKIAKRLSAYFVLEVFGFILGLALMLDTEGTFKNIGTFYNLVCSCVFLSAINPLIEFLKYLYNKNKED